MRADEKSPSVVQISGSRRRDVVRRRRVLEPELVERAVAARPGVAGDDGLPRRQLVEAGGRRDRAAAPRAGRLLVLLRIANEERLRVVDLAVHAAEVQIAVGRSKERAFDRRVELRLPGPDGVELVHLGALISAEEVHAIEDDRAAQAAAELMPAVIGLDGLEDALGVQALVAEVLERIAVQIVAARLGHDLDHAAGRQPELRLVLNVADLELLDRVLGEVLARLAVLGEIVDHAVHDVAGAVEGHRPADVDGGEERSRGVLTRSRHQQRQRQVLP